MTQQATKAQRVIVYEMANGTEQVFAIESAEHEQHERTNAERELHSRDSQVVGYPFEVRTIVR